MNLTAFTVDESMLGTESNSAEKVNVLVGDDVLLRLKDEKFRSDWVGLYQSCSWATVFQNLYFVAAWYQLYHEKFLPLLVEQTSEEGTTGILALAKDEGGTIIGAGANQAEYQVWMTRGSGGEFASIAFRKLRSLFPNSTVRLKYVPSGAPLVWVSQSAYWRKRCLVKEFVQPLLVIDEQALSQELRKKNRREKINRLNRLGSLSLEKVSCNTNFGAVLEELAVQFDFRKGATVNKTPFRNDPFKKPFLLALFGQGLLHASVLKLNNEVIASNVGAVGKGWLHLQGVNTHSPFYAKHSPGILHFLMLGKHLAKENITVFDLTPGGDPYKDALATEYTTAYTLTVGSPYTHFYSQAKHRVASRVKSSLISIGISKADQKNIKKKVQVAKEKLANNLTRGAGHTLAGTLVPKRAAASKTYFIDVANLELTCDPEMSFEENSLECLLRYEPAGGANPTRWEFLSDAMRRLEWGQRCYTWSDRNRLLACAWLEEGPELGELYCHASGRSSLADFLRAAAQRAAQATGQERVRAKTCDVAVCRALEAAGFTPWTG